MAIFTVTFVVVLISPGLWHGAFGYMALVSVLLGASCFIVVKFILKDKTEPEYLPNPSGDADPDGAQEEAEGDGVKADEKNDTEES